MTIAPRRPERQVSRATYIRRWIAVTLAAAIVGTVGIYLPATLLVPLAASPASLSTFHDPKRDAAALEWPNFGASAIGVVGYPAANRSSGATSALPMASISKIITSLVVLEVKPLATGENGPTITFSRSDAALAAKYIAQNGEVKPMTAGSKMSQLDLMRITLVASANNYAAALAIWAYGSEKKFVAAARVWLDAHSLTSTTLVEPTGISASNISTAKQLVALGQLAMANPVIAAIVDTETLSLAGVGTFDNTNLLLGHDGVEGIKTGTLNGTSNLLFAARYSFGPHTVTVIGAILGGSNRASLDRSVSALLASARSSFHEVTVASKGEPFATYRTPWSATSTAVATRDATVLVWGDTPVTALVQARPVAVNTAPSGVGEVVFRSGDRSVAVPLTLTRRLPAPSAVWRLTNPFARS